MKSKHRLTSCTQLRSQREVLTKQALHCGACNWLDARAVRRYEIGGQMQGSGANRQMGQLHVCSTCVRNVCTQRALCVGCPHTGYVEAKQSSPEERYKTGFTMQDSVKTVRR